MRICLCSKNSFILIIDSDASMEKLIYSGPSDAASVREGVGGGGDVVVYLDVVVDFDEVVYDNVIGDAMMMWMLLLLFFR